MKKCLLLLFLFGFAFNTCMVIKKVMREEIEDDAALSFEKGNNYFKEKEYEKAIIELEKVVKTYPQTKAYQPALYLLSLSHFRLNGYERAIYYGKKFLKEFPNSGYLTKILGMLGEANLKLVNDYEAVYYFIKSHKSSSDTTERRLAREKINNLLPELSIAELEKLNRTFMSEPIVEEILYHLIRAEIKEGKEKEAKRDLEVLTRRFPDTNYAHEFEDFRRVIHMGTASGKAGVLLPLSGKFAIYGKKLLEIVESFERKKELPFSLVPMDTKSDPIGALLAAVELIESKKVDFIIGPLFSIEALSVVGFAYARGIPVIIPTNIEIKFDQLSTVLMPGQTLNEQARAIARYSLNQLDFTKFAILQPDIPKYKGLSQIFINEIIRNNGEVVAVETFNPDSVTLKWELGRIKRKRPEAIFLSMDTDMLINTAPQIYYYGLEGVKLLGVESFYNEKVPRLGERYVESSFFAVLSQSDSTSEQGLKTFDIESGDLVSSRFIKTLQELKELKNYDRVNLLSELNNLFKGQAKFAIWTIRGGEFVKLSEVFNN